MKHHNAHTGIFLFIFLSAYCTKDAVEIKKYKKGSKEFTIYYGNRYPKSPEILNLREKKIYIEPDEESRIIGNLPEESISKNIGDAKVEIYKNNEKEKDFEFWDQVDFAGLRGFIKSEDDLKSGVGDDLKKNLNGYKKMREFSLDFFPTDGSGDEGFECTTLSLTMAPDMIIRISKENMFKEEFPFHKKIENGKWEISNSKTTLILKKETNGVGVEIVKDGSGNFKKLGKKSWTFTEKGRCN